MANGRNLGKIAPAQAGIAITPDDDSDLGHKGLVLTCTTAGEAVVHDMNGTSLTIYLNAGAVFPLQVRRVLSTGTTAAGIVGLVI